MGLFNWISSIFKPAAELVDDLHLSGEEKGQLKNELAGIQQKANEKFIELELAALEARKAVMIAESQSSNWYQAAWRPIASMVLVGLVVIQCIANWAYDVPISAELFTFASTFLGITSAGRGIEKAAKANRLGQ